jgi:hypothetical protein
MKDRPAHSAVKRTRRRGFVGIFSITMIILVGSALVALSAYFAMDARRTRAQAQDAQLRQLLIAGAAAALDRADSTGKSALDLPKELADAKVSIEIAGGGDDRKAWIIAKIEKREFSQALSLHRSAGKWSLVSAQLDASSQPLAPTQPSERSTAASQRS